MQTVDMQQLKAGEVNLGVSKLNINNSEWLKEILRPDFDHGRAVQGRRRNRRRFTNNNRKLHRK